MSTKKSIIYFYTPEIESVPKNSEETMNPKFYSTGLHHWVHLTYSYFKYINRSHSYDVLITAHVPEEGIIVFHRGSFPQDRKPNSKQLFVCMQVDYGKHRYAQIQVIHNPRSVNNYRLSTKSLFDKFFSFTKEAFVPSWPQPGLIVRSRNRQYKIENICFMGHAKNLPKELRSTEWQKKCEELKVNFQIVNESEKWSDFSEIDLVLAMRSFGKKLYYNKPFLKITNAIFAGVPVIATPESSHLYLKHDKTVDFPIVDNPSELAAVIKRMKNNPLPEFQKIEINQQLIKEYSFEGVFEYYNRLFDDCENMFRKWTGAGPIKRYLFLKIRQFRFSLK